MGTHCAKDSGTRGLRYESSLTRAFSCITLGDEMGLKLTSLRLPAEDMKRLAKIAKKEGLKPADIMRRAIREFLKK